MADACVVAPLLLWSNNISVFYWFLGLSEVLKGVSAQVPAEILDLGAFKKSSNFLKLPSSAVSQVSNWIAREIGFLAVHLSDQQARLC
jgi:hypothetical protein